MRKNLVKTITGIMMAATVVGTAATTTITSRAADYDDYYMYQMQQAQQELEYNQIREYMAAEEAAKAMAEYQKNYIIEENEMCNKVYKAADGYNADKVQEVVYKFAAKYSELTSYTDYTIIPIKSHVVYKDAKHVYTVDDEWIIVKNR